MRGGFSQPLTLGAFAGFIGFGAILVALHVVRPDLSPTTDAVSYYVHGPYGALFTIALAALGLGSLALVGALSLELGREAFVGAWLLALWGLCVFAGAVYPTDPRTFGGTTQSISGVVHGTTAIVAFAMMPLGAVLLVGVLRRRLGVPFIGILTAWTVASPVFISIVPMLGLDQPFFRVGAVERFLLASYVAWLSTVAWSVARRARA